MENRNELIVFNNNTYLNISNDTTPMPSLELLDKNWQSFLIVLYSLTAALSLVGNVVAIWVLMAGKRSSRELRMFLVNLSLSDITMAIFSIPFTYTDFMFGRWIFMPQFCPIVQFMQLTSVFVSVYTLTAIGIDRYVAIIYPLGTSRLTKSLGPYIVTVIWISGVILGFITWNNSAAEPFSWGNETYYDCKETWTQESGRIYTCALFCITFALPMIILTYVYGSVALKMFRHSAPGNADAVRDEAQLIAKKKVIKMLATIVILFAICWIPIQVNSLLVWFAREWLETIYQTESGYRAYIAFTIGSHWLSMANSFVNPIIYCFMSDNFRSDLRLLGTKCCTRTQTYQRSYISSHGLHGSGKQWSRGSAPNQLASHSALRSVLRKDNNNDNTCTNESSMVFKTEVFALSSNGNLIYDNDECKYDGRNEIAMTMLRTNIDTFPGERDNHENCAKNKL